MTHLSIQRTSYSQQYYPETLLTPATTSTRTHHSQQQQTPPPLPPLPQQQTLPGSFPASRPYTEQPAQFSQTSSLHNRTSSPSSLTPYANDMNVKGTRDMNGVARKDMYEYTAPWSVYGLDWSKRPGDKAFRLALGSFIEEYANKVCES